MFCRVCGHDNGDRGTGKCSNCGFDLEYMTRPMSEQRSALRSRSDRPLELGDTTFRTHHPSRTGLLGVGLGMLGTLTAAYIILNFERAQVLDTPPDVVAFDSMETDLPVDSISIRIGSDIVYVLNETGTSAEPHTNLNLSLIPEGSSVGFIGRRELPIRPMVAFIERKRSEGAAARLNLNALCAWDDSTETSFVRVPLVVGDPNPPDSSTAPVQVKVIFTDQWIDGRVEEFDIDIPSPISGGQFSQYKFDSVMTQINNRLIRRDLGGRAVEVITMFPESTALGRAVDIMQQAYPTVAGLGYRGLGLRYFVLER